MKKSINDFSKIVFFGGGVLAERLYRQIDGIQDKLVGVFDLLGENRSIKSFKGFSVKNAKEQEYLINNDEVAIMVAIGHFGVYKFVNQLRSLYPCIDDRLYIVNPYCSLRFFMVDDELAREERVPFDNPKYQKLKSLLKDEESIRHFKLLTTSKPFENNQDNYEIIKYTTLGDMYYYTEDYWNTYKFKTNGDVSLQATVLDCGAYIGDSVEDICKTIPESDVYYYAFEPLQSNIKQMKDNDLFSRICKEFNIVECGVGEENKELFFHLPNNGDQEGGRFIDQAEGSLDKLAIRRIDDIDISYKGTVYIKMDIEGAELSALKGALQTIKKYRPYMAICLYHRKNDLIDIPLFIESLELNYKFYLRGGYHTILWAIPENKKITN